MFRISKIYNYESNSQRVFLGHHIKTGCSEYQRYTIMKAIHNKQNNIINKELDVQNIKDIQLWKQFTTIVSLWNQYFWCSEYQRYTIMKAIHNTSTKKNSLIVCLYLK